MVQRQVVYYFPHAGEKTEGRIIIGAPSSGLKGARSSHIGCFVWEQKDSGGWGESSDCLAIPEDSSIGRLDYCQVESNQKDACDCKCAIFSCSNHSLKFSLWNHASFDCWRTLEMSWIESTYSQIYVQCISTLHTSILFPCILPMRLSLWDNELANFKGE